MDKITEFKEFVRSNPSLVKYVNNNEMNWQKFYEMYDIYGGQNEVWNKYLNKTETVETVAKTVGIADVLGWFKNIDLDSFQSNINNIQRVVGVLQDLGSKDTKTAEYKPRPIYKHFED